MGEDTSSHLARTPWVSSIGHISDSTWIHKCIGSIISKHMILAPGHCLQDIDNSIKVKVGSEFLSMNSSIYDIDFVEFHPEFNNTKGNVQRLTFTCFMTVLYTKWRFYSIKRHSDQKFVKKKIVYIQA